MVVTFAILTHSLQELVEQWSQKFFFSLLLALNVYCRYFEVLVFCVSCTDSCASLKKCLYVHALVVHVFDQRVKGQCLVCILVDALLLCLKLFDVLTTLLFFCALPFPYVSGNVHSKFNFIKGYMLIDFLIADSASLRTWFHSTHLNRRL